MYSPYKLAPTPQDHPETALIRRRIASAKKWRSRRNRLRALAFVFGRPKKISRGFPRTVLSIRHAAHQ